MKNLAMRLKRPTGYYLPLIEGYVAALAQTDAMGVSVQHARSLDKTLKKNGLRPSARWYGPKKAFVPPPRKPTATPSLSAKGKAAVSSPKGGGISRALRGVVSIFAQPTPYRPSKPAPMLFAYKKPEYT